MTPTITWPTDKADKVGKDKVDKVVKVDKVDEMDEVDKMDEVPWVLGVPHQVHLYTYIHIRYIYAYKQ